MPIPAISLLGFMSQPEAIAYLSNACVPVNMDPAALAAEWAAAQTKLGPAPANAGIPTISDIPPSEQPYVDQLRNGPWKQVFDANPGWAVKLVEIEPLLAWQFSILTNKSANHCGGLGMAPPLPELLKICLPQVPPTPSAHVSRGDQSIMIQSRDLNLRAVEAGLMDFTMGLRFTFSLPFVHVVRYNGRCYLLNGFHRSYGAGLVGAKQVPCIFRDVATPEEAGIRADGLTFSLQLLEGPNPPTLAHFIRGEAYDVQVKPLNRVLHVSWAEYLVPDEEF